MRRIAVRTIGDLAPGMFIAEVDSDEYPVDTFVPADHYEVEDQDWNRVARIAGPVDLRTLVLEYYDGTPHTSRWQSTATVWVLFDGDAPVVQDEPNE